MRKKNRHSRTDIVCAHNCAQQQRSATIVTGHRKSCAAAKRRKDRERGGRERERSYANRRLSFAPIVCRSKLAPPIAAAYAPDDNRRRCHMERLRIQPHANDDGASTTTFVQILSQRRRATLICVYVHKTFCE